jgi:hypothetical protein
MNAGMQVFRGKANDVQIAAAVKVVDGLDAAAQQAVEKEILIYMAASGYAATSHQSKGSCLI